MCVLPVAAAALSIASSAAGFMGASQQASQQNDYYLRNAQAANIAAGNQYAHLQLRESQSRDAASRDMTQMGIEGMRARASAHTAAGEAGVSGLSVDALMGNYFASEGRQRDARAAQYGMDRSATLAEMDNVKAQAEARINSVQRARKPSALPFIIGGLSGAAGAFQRG